VKKPKEASKLKHIDLEITIPGWSGTCDVVEDNSEAYLFGMCGSV
jgi:hypothetical protein